MRDAEIKEIPTSLLMEVGGDMEEKQESIIPNRSIDCKSVTSNGKDYFLSSFIFLLASCFLFVLDVSRYAIEPTKTKLLNNQIKYCQDLMTDWGLFQTSLDSFCFSFITRFAEEREHVLLVSLHTRLVERIDIEQ